MSANSTLHGQAKHSAELSSSLSYIVRGLQDLANGIGRELNHTTKELAEAKVDLQSAQEHANQPFPQEAELTQKSERLAFISDALRKEAMSKMNNGEKQGRKTFYFDKERRAELRAQSQQAGQRQKPQEPQRENDALDVT